MPHLKAECWRARLDLEPFKDDQKHEEIVETERHLNHIAADEFQRGLAALRNGKPSGKTSRGLSQNYGPDPYYAGPCSF